jgi:hypothetical protein
LIKVRQVTIPSVWWKFMVVAANAANAYLVPHIAPDYVAGFTAALLTGLIMVFTTYENGSK